MGDRRAAMKIDRTVSVGRMIRNILLNDAEEYMLLMLVEGEAEVENDGDEEGKETAIGSGGQNALTA